MSIDPQVAVQQPQTDTSDKNLVKQRKYYESQINELRSEIEQLRQIRSSDEDDSGEPYIDQKRLDRRLSKAKEEIKQDTQTDIQRAVQTAIAEERRQAWLKANPDFSQIMQHVEKFAETDPELAETLLAMPQGFEREKLVYKNIKMLGLHNPAKPAQSIQDTIEKNRRSPYYQPSGVGAAPYGVGNGGRNYSESEGQQALAKMRELQKNLRL